MVAYPFPSAATEALVDSSTERLRRLHPISTPNDDTSGRVTHNASEEEKRSATYLNIVYDLGQEITAQREEAEGVRLAYVAATRARDLLVIPAVGDEPFPDGGWVSPLNGAIYPPNASPREQHVAPGCPSFKSKDSVLSRPNGDPALPSTVCPGPHRVPSPKSRVAGGHRVVWWDPSVLILDAEATEGVRRPELIVKDVSEQVVEAGLADYHAWRAQRDEATRRGSQPSLVVRTVRDHVRFSAGVSPRPAPGTPHPAPGTRHPAPDDNVPVIAVSRVADRPVGPRFGTLVHAVLAVVPLDAGAEGIREVVALQGRVLGAGDEEVAAAAEVAGRVLGHDLLVRAGAAARGRPAYCYGV